jgi:hypothetical protein
MDSDLTVVYSKIEASTDRVDGRAEWTWMEVANL